MNDIKLEFLESNITFDIEQYNQLHVVDTKNFLKTMIRLKNLEGDKFDEHYQNKYKGNSYLFDQKLNSKNILILDLNDFSKIINNLSFHKSSIIRKLYYHDMMTYVDEDSVEAKVLELLDVFDYSDDITLIDKEIGREKIFDTLFSGYLSSNYLDSTTELTELVIEYIDTFELTNAILIVDSSIKFFDLEPLIKDERIIIFDTNIQYNKNTSNIIVFGSEVENYNIGNIIEKIEFHWPDEIEIKSINSLLQVCWHIILNDEIENLDYPSDNLLCLYIIIRKLLNLPITINREISFYSKSQKITNYINENLL